MSQFTPYMMTCRVCGAFRPVGGCACHLTGEPLCGDCQDWYMSFWTEDLFGDRRRTILAWFYPERYLDPAGQAEKAES